ncbi:uncharacterized protein N7511_010721 [Penicillium nucicola]|uniref:uncharacterized protein n=1 Tax=Penicillium nucicola TaxID=1850975 RepID=UPI0025453195|nr:uncharacterized protein N7511_010721 [Penicillium nucicola]KAJ5749025.1 hypothetical protein N7511_010721 [Penicillium nucicola]
MSQRLHYSAWQDERDYFVSTLSIQMDILKHSPMRRDEVIKTLDQLLLRTPRFRLAGQAVCDRDRSLSNYLWTKRCNELFDNVAALRQTLLRAVDCATLADSTEMLALLQLCTFDHPQTPETNSPRRRQNGPKPRKGGSSSWFANNGLLICRPLGVAGFV